ncbi:hypothetical protein V2V72_07725 [Streptococcus agalactiae]
MNLIHNLTAWDQTESESFKLSVDTDKIIAITEENFTIIDDFLSEKMCYGSGILTGTGQYYFVMKPYKELIEMINEKPPEIELGVLTVKMVDKKLGFETNLYVKNIGNDFNSHIEFTGIKSEAMQLTKEEAKCDKYNNFDWVSLKEEKP